MGCSSWSYLNYDHQLYYQSATEITSNLLKLGVRGEVEIVRDEMLDVGEGGTEFDERNGFESRTVARSQYHGDALFMLGHMMGTKLRVDQFDIYLGRSADEASLTKPQKRSSLPPSPYWESSLVARELSGAMNAGKQPPFLLTS